MTDRPAVEPRVLPDGARLLHIGPHKTGTTALQTALYVARPRLLEQGVRHAGASRNPSPAVRAVVGQSSPYAVGKPPSMRLWRSLVGDIRGASEPRVVVSCEIFAWADEAAIRRIVDDLDQDRVHVAVTLRQLAKVLPSTWQQNVQASSTTSFQAWLESVLTTDPKQERNAFWTLQRHDELIERWAAVVGRDRVTAIVVDDRDHAVLLRSFEGLLGLRTDTLVADRDVMNRSLTLPEAEAVRAYNIAFYADGLPRDLHARSMRFGAAQLMKRRVPPADEPRVELPAWATDRVAAIQDEIVANIRASGTRVIGDLATLTAPFEAAASSETTTSAIPPEVAASMAMGVLVASGAVRSAAASRGPFRVAEPVELARIPTYQLFGSVVVRAWRASVGRLVGRGRPTSSTDDEASSAAD